MKVALTLLLLVAGGSALPADDIYLELVGGGLNNLIREFLEYLRMLLRNHDPYKLPPMPQEHIVDDDIDFVISAHDVLLSQAADFTIDKISTNVPLLKSSFGITEPKANSQGSFQVKGTAFGKNIQGEGTYSLQATQLAGTADVQFHIVDHSLQIKTLKLDYSIGDLQGNVEGLSVEGLSQEEIQEILNKRLLQYLNNNKEFVAEHVANHAMEVINELMKGKSLQDIIDWLKLIAASTPDPPPFTFPA